jgi:hypothetical protein
VSNSIPPSLIAQLKVLDPNQIQRIDAALTAVGDFATGWLISFRASLISRTSLQLVNLYNAQRDDTMIDIWLKPNRLQWLLADSG